MARFATVLVLACLGFSVAVPAQACLRQMPKMAKKQQVDPTRRDVLAAEKALAKGDHAKAAKLARRAVPGLHGLPPASAVELATRAQRVLALAVVRTKGAIEISDEMPGKTEADRSLNLAWAQLMLNYHAAVNPDNLVMKVQLAEALASTEFGREHARDILRDLSTRDLMPMASGYAILASLESDTVMRDAALTRCRDLGGTACQA